jgi:hypothetical protein
MLQIGSRICSNLRSTCTAVVVSLSQMRDWNCGSSLIHCHLPSFPVRADTFSCIRSAVIGIVEVRCQSTGGEPLREWWVPSHILSTLTSFRASSLLVFNEKLLKCGAPIRRLKGIASHGGVGMWIGMWVGMWLMAQVIHNSS